MVDFCPECGSVLRNRPCKCGYKDHISKNFSKNTAENISVFWDPPNPRTLYCRITGVPYRKLKYNINQGLYLIYSP